MIEDNSGYLAERIWRKQVLPSFFCEMCAFVALNLVSIFLISRYCSQNDFVIFSAFLPSHCLFTFIDAFFGDGASTCFSISKGANDSRKAQFIFAENLTTYLVLVTFLFLFLCWQMPAVVSFLKLPSELSERAICYGRILSIYGIFYGLVQVFQDFLTNDSLPKVSAMISVWGLIALVVSVIFFIGILHYGIITFIIIQTVIYFLQILVSLIPIIRKKTTIHLQFKWMTLQTFKDIFSLSCGMLVCLVISLAVLTLYIRWLLSCYGPSAATINAVFGTIVALYVCLNKVSIHAMQSIAGVFRGEKNYFGIRVCFKKTWVRGAIAISVIGLFVVIFPQWILYWLPVKEEYIPGVAVFALRIIGIIAPLHFSFEYLISYYNVCGHAKMISIITVITQGIIYPLDLILYFFIIKDGKIFWLYYPTAIILYFLLIFVITTFIKKKQHCDDLLLLPHTDETILRSHYLLQSRSEDLADYREMMLLFLHKHNADSKVVQRAALLFEELFLFAREHSNTKNGRYFAMTLTLASPQKLELSLHFESDESCLDSALNGRQLNLPPEDISGAMILKKLSDKIYIDRIYGFNYVLLTIDQSRM